jgi:glycosyltransferase involved in cell wall biosynthesis
MPLISIIIPVYNVDNYIRECLDSVLSQTFTDYECILIDDGSQDNCPAICDEYAEKDFRFIVIHKKNSGQSDARNEGIKAAKGEYIVFLDADDLFADNKALENIWKISETTKTDIICNINVTIIRDKNFSLFNNFDKDFIHGDAIQFYKRIKPGLNIITAPWSFTLQRDFLLRHDLFFKTGIVHEDEHWIPRVICAASRVAVNHNLFYTYRTKRPGSTMSTLTPKRLFDMISIIEDITGWLKIKDIKTIHRCIYLDWIVHLLRSVFYQSILLDAKYYPDMIILLKKSKEYSTLLLRKFSLKSYKLYILINFINSNYKRLMFYEKYLEVKKKITCRKSQ